MQSDMGVRFARALGCDLGCLCICVLMNIKTLFLDFDDVLRIWQSEKISKAEYACQVENGILLQIAFSNQYLIPAITGNICHEQWRRLVTDALRQKYGSEVAASLVAAWDAESWDIDDKLLMKLTDAAPQHRLVLVTNATDKLNEDLVRSGLDSTFDHVINSSEIGCAKPDPLFFEKALSISNATVENTVFIDDSVSNVMAARELGIFSILHESTSKTVRAVASKCA